MTDHEQLTYPRLVYRGKQDVLGLGLHTDPETGELVGETKTVNSPEELAQAKKDGWRLTAEDPDAGAKPKHGDPDYAARPKHGDPDDGGTPKAKK